MHLDGREIGKQPALPLACIRMMSIMFKITQNTLSYFTLAEVLLMAAMNQLETKQKVGGNEGSKTSYCSFRAEAA